MPQTERGVTRVGRGHIEVKSQNAADAATPHWEHSLPKSYADFTVDPFTVGALCPDQEALPQLGDPKLLPSVQHGVAESLIPVTGDRITSQTVYFDAGWTEAAPFVVARRGVVDRLRTAAATLPANYGLCVLDAWRPLSLQAALHAQAPAGFKCAPNDDPALPPPHLSGGAVDITLTWDGQPLALGTEFDVYGDDAWTAAFEETPGLIRELRRLLFWSMRGAGFVVLDCEWYHFEHGTPRWAALTGEDAVYAAVAP